LIGYRDIGEHFGGCCRTHGQNAQHHRDERRQMPGLGRPQRPAQNLGGGETRQTSDQRPQRPNRQAEQPPRCPRQAGHQHHAGGQHSHREYNPAHRRRLGSEHGFLPRRAATSDRS
jgi:hypothetical protein